MKNNGQNITNQVPPHSYDSEIQVLGSMMLDTRAVFKAQELLTPESFFSEANKVIYETMTNLANENVKPDIRVLIEELDRQNYLELAGGTFYLTDINAKTPTAANVEFHIRIVKEYELKRKIINISKKALGAAYDQSSDVFEEIEKLQEETFSLSDHKISNDIQSITQINKKTRERIIKFKEHGKDGITGVPSGFIDIDKETLGFQDEDLIFLAGRPSMGKTALALRMAVNAAKEGYPVAFFSIEIGNISLAIRNLSSEAKVNHQRIKSGKYSKEEFQEIERVMNNMEGLPLMIDDSPELSIMDFRSKCRRLKNEGNLDIVFVDYLQLMKPPKAESREREVSIISRQLKIIAKELKVPIVVLAQLNRELERRADKMPMLSDLRESGSIEQDADGVLFVFRPEVYGEEEYQIDKINKIKKPTGGLAIIVFAKQRNGPSGSLVLLNFDSKYTRFTDYSAREEEIPGDDPADVIEYKQTEAFKNN